jgi:cytochrome c
VSVCDPHARPIAALLSCVLAAVSLAPPAAAQDATAGQRVFTQCAACHSIDGSTKTGPTLKGIIGRKAGAIAEFRYSRAMKRAAIVWDAATLDAYLSHPQQEIPGNTMPFAGIADAKQRADLVAYLQTLQ